MLAIQFDQVAHAPEQLIARKLLDLDDLALERAEVLVHAIFDVLDEALVGRGHEMHQVLGARAQLIRGASQMKARHAAAVFVRALRRRPGERERRDDTYRKYRSCGFGARSGPNEAL